MRHQRYQTKRQPLWVGVLRFRIKRQTPSGTVRSCLATRLCRISNHDLQALRCNTPASSIAKIQKRERISASRLTDLIAKTKAKDSALGAELDREFKILSSRLPFGLNFERHSPEAVELPLRPIRKGDKVRVLPERGSTKKGGQRLWHVKTLHKTKKAAVIELLGAAGVTQTVTLDELVVVAEFRDTIYLDPPYNSGAKDWKYNNDYVEKDDSYRHSKWLAMMERRLSVAKELLNPADSVLIVTIDEKEVHRLSLLLEQILPEAKVQMITSVISQNGIRESNWVLRRLQILREWSYDESNQVFP